LKPNTTMQDFNLYFGLGINHIITWQALDHLLFVAALCLRYSWQQWKKVAVLVTAFTIGHAVALMLAGFGYLQVPVKLIEFIIPLTIAITAIDNLRVKQKTAKKKLPLIYFMALFFGMIHGLAYAITLLNLEGANELVIQLFAFNLGIEFAQLLVVAIVLAVSFIFVNVMKVNKTGWVKVLSVIILLVALKMAVKRVSEMMTVRSERLAVRGEKADEIKCLNKIYSTSTVRSER
jgi:HupE / UreJ protein